MFFQGFWPPLVLLELFVCLFVCLQFNVRLGPKSPLDELKPNFRLLSRNVMRIRFYLLLLLLLLLLLFSKSYYVSNYLCIIHVGGTSILFRIEEWWEHEDLMSSAYFSFLSSYIPTHKRRLLLGDKLWSLDLTKLIKHHGLYIFLFFFFFINFKLRGFASWVLTSVFFFFFPFHNKNIGRIFEIFR